MVLFNEAQREVLADLISGALLTQHTKARKEALGELVHQLMDYIHSDDPSCNPLEFKQACGLELDGSEPCYDVSPRPGCDDNILMNDDTYDGPGLASADLGNGYEVYLVYDLENRVSLRSRPLNGRRDYDYWLINIRTNGVQRCSHICNECGVATRDGLVINLKDLG